MSTFPNFRQIIRKVYDAVNNAIRVLIVNDSSDPFAVDPGAGDGKITNITSPAINTELTYALSTDLKGIIIKARKPATLRIAITANGTKDSGTGSNKYVEIPSGGFFQKDLLSWDSKTLYYQTSRSVTIEIMEFF